ncbi:hypothetical protein HMPREF1205_02100 [Bacteroides fragilis HMW 616]|nr:hypothetical protein HMPREF1205_02100 [Bacteroides fragilis HMW 616]
MSKNNISGGQITTILMTIFCIAELIGVTARYLISIKQRFGIAPSCNVASLLRFHTLELNAWQY